MTKFYNNFKTVALLAGLIALCMAVGSIWGPYGLLIGFLFGGAGNVIAYFFSDKIAIGSMRGQQVDEQSAPDLIHMVHRLADNAGLPMPRVYVCPQEAPNAFATGRSPRHAAVAITQGALRLLSFDELEGVIGHELGHVKNRDTLTSTVAATIAGAISALAWIGLWFGFGDSRENPLLGLAVLLLAPVAATLIQLAISRSREFVADQEGARLAGTPDGLISALRKLETVSQRVPLRGGTPAFHHLFIVNPLSNVGRGLSRLFMTHPPTEERIARLEALHGRV